MSIPEPSTYTVTAIVLAGGNSSDPLARSAGVTSKAHVPYRNKPLAGWVLEALRSSSRVDKIIFLGELPGGVPAPDHVLPAGERFSDTVALGFGAALATAPGSRLLICTADLPWLTGEAVDAFIEGSSADLNYPIITKQIAQEQFPEQKRTWVRLKQGEFTGGNLALLSARAVPPLLQLIGRLFAARKNPLVLGSLFGLGTIVALLRGQADLPKLEQQASELLGYPVRAVMARHAGLGADADKPEHLPRD